jgi:hypothetical protein
VAALALSPAPALAAITHPYTGKSFGSEGLNSGGPLGKFENPQGIAIEQSSGIVYVYDAGAGAIYKFNASGEPAPFSKFANEHAEHPDVIAGVGTTGTDEGEIAVDNSTGPTKGDIYVATGEDGYHVLIYSPTGEALGELDGFAGSSSGTEAGSFQERSKEPCGVAVDSSGDVYVGLYDGEVSQVAKYAPKTGAVTNEDYTSSLFKLDYVCNIAANPEGAVYTTPYFGSGSGTTKYPASEFTTPTQFVAEREPGSRGAVVDTLGNSLAIDELTSDLYADETNAIAEYNSSGTLLGRSGAAGEGALSESYGVAVDHASGDLYADNGASGLVEIFGPPVVVPDVSTAPASDITPTRARLEGSVNPDETSVSSCEFEYGTETSYGQTIPCNDAVPFSGNVSVAVSATLDDLQKNTAYHYRLVARNPNGTSYGSDATFTTPLPPPTVTISAVSEIGRNTARFNGTVNPAGDPASYRFEESPDGVHWTALAESSAGEGETEVPVTRAVSGLTGNTTYHVRLVASSGGESATSAETTFSTLASPPQAFGTIASELTVTSATLSAVIYPENLSATYQFQYGPSTAYGSSIPAYPEEEIDSPQRVSQSPQGLSSGTVYHFRVVATNSAGTTVGPDETFTTLTTGESGREACPNEARRAESDVDPLTDVPYSMQLPDCRAYEQVTPEGKDGASIGLTPGASTSGVTTISNPGSPLTASSTSLWGSPSGAEEVLGGTIYELARGSASWTAASLTPPTSDFPLSTELLHPPGTEASLWLAATPLLPQDATNLYRRNSDGTFVEIGPIAPPAATTQPPRGASAIHAATENDLKGVAASRDLSHVFFTIAPKHDPSEPDYFWPGDDTSLGGQTAPLSIPSLYEYVGTGHTGEGDDAPSLVGIDNEGTQLTECGTALGTNNYANYYRSLQGTVSAAGTTVFFNAQAGGCVPGATGPAVDELYARVGSPGGDQITVNVAGTSECMTSISCNVTSPVTYAGASSDGSKVFFTTKQALLPSDEDTTNDIYECNLPGDDAATPTATGLINACPELKAVSVTGTTSGANVQNVLAISEEGTRVYFTATGVLTSVPNDQGRAAQPGGNNLYVWEAPSDGEPAGRTAFIATLPEGAFAGEAHGREAQETPDGSYFLFASTADLTLDDTSTAAQIFRYDAKTGELTRVSVGQADFNDNGNTNRYSATIPPITESDGVEERGTAISNDGAFVVFQSSDALTTRVQGGLHNVYEWHDGNVSLISDGSDAFSPTTAQGAETATVGLIGLDSSGADIFFTTKDRLVGQDTDESVDVYDARVDGGFPKPTPEPSCSGEGCQGELSSSLTASSPLISSAGLPAIGNLAPPKKTITAAGEVDITRHAVKGATITLSIATSGKGELSASGAGLKTEKKAVAKAGTYTLKLTLTKADKASLRKHRKLKLRIKVSFAPSSGAVSSATITITVKR